MLTANTTTNTALFETDEYTVGVAPNGLPVRFNDAGTATVRMPGYVVTHKATDQPNGEFRSLADAMVAAIKWTQDIKAVRQAASGITIPKPKLAGLN